MANTNLRDAPWWACCRDRNASIAFWHRSFSGMAPLGVVKLIVQMKFLRLHQRVKYVHVAVLVYCDDWFVRTLAVFVLFIRFYRLRWGENRKQYITNSKNLAQSLVLQQFWTCKLKTGVQMCMQTILYKKFYLSTYRDVSCLHLYTMWELLIFCWFELDNGHHWKT